MQILSSADRNPLSAIRILVSPAEICNPRFRGMRTLRCGFGVAHLGPVESGAVLTDAKIMTRVNRTTISNRVLALWLKLVRNGYQDC